MSAFKVGRGIALIVAAAIGIVVFVVIVFGDDSSRLRPVEALVPAITFGILGFGLMNAVVDAMMDHASNPIHNSPGSLGKSRLHFGPTVGRVFWREGRRDGSHVCFHHPVRMDAFLVLVISVVVGGILYAYLGYIMPATAEPEGAFLCARWLAGSLVLAALCLSTVLMWTHHHMRLDIANRHLAITTHTPFASLKASIGFSDVNAIQIREVVTQYNDGTMTNRYHVELLLSDRIIQLGSSDAAQARTLAVRLSELTDTPRQDKIELCDGGDPPEPYVPN
jgi:hypothetical protein